jgi:hypothetical protein
VVLFDFLNVWAWKRFEEVCSPWERADGEKFGLVCVSCHGGEEEVPQPSSCLNVTNNKQNAKKGGDCQVQTLLAVFFAFARFEAGESFMCGFFALKGAKAKKGGVLFKFKPYSPSSSLLPVLNRGNCSCADFFA